MRTRLDRSSRGFTIVELMVALSVLSILLLMVTVALVNLGKLFTKGNVEATTQNITRNVLNQIVADLQFGGNTPQIVNSATPLDTATTASGVNAFCIGNQRYTYKLNAVVTDGTVTDTTVPHALWHDTLKVSNGVCAPVIHFDGSGSGPQSDPAALSGSGAELINPGMRLLDFNLSPVATSGGINGVYSMKITLAYGTYAQTDHSDDLVNFDPGTEPKNQADNTTCHGGTGTEFCAVASLTETVVQRVKQ